MLHSNQCGTYPAVRTRTLPLVLLTALMTALLSVALPASAQRARLTHAEAPAQLIRKTAVYDAPAGTALHPGDLIGTGPRSVQLEWPAGVLLALGPDSLLLVDDAAAFPAVTLVRGWAKVTAGRLNVAAGPLSVAAAGSGILHVAADTAELFVEQGSFAAAVPDRPAPGGPVQVGREHYAVFPAPQGLQPAGRPPRPFVAAMPRGFFDPLVAVGARVKPAEPVLLREANAADVARWNDAAASVRRQLATRFAPRLADPTFRAAAASALAQQPEWRQALKDASAPRKRSNTLPSTLF